MYRANSVTGQKSCQDRALVKVRNHIGAALDSLDKAEGVSPNLLAKVFNTACAPFSKDAQRTEVLKSLRRDLELAQASLLNAESLTGPSFASGGRTHWNHFSKVDDEDTRQWLSSNFEQAPGAKQLSAERLLDPNGLQSLTLAAAALRESSKTAMSEALVTEMLDNVGTFDFDAMKFCSHDLVRSQPITMVGASIQHQRALIRRMHENGRLTGEIVEFESAFGGFLRKLDELYKPDAIYHSSVHAVDVMSTSTWFMKSSYISSHCNKPIDHFLTLIAAAIHDVGHPGINNLFLTKTMDPLALRYNDRSVLESMHLALTFETMAANESCNWFSKLLPEGQTFVRQGLISMVLATDMATHAAMVKKIGAFDPNDPEPDTTFILETVLHASDISNPAKPQSQMLGWTKRVTEEFWAQGDEEQRLELPISPLCERASGMASVPKGQIGFISFVVMPYFECIQRVIKEAQTAVDGLNRTKEFWEKVHAEGWTYDQIFDGVSCDVLKRPSISG